MPAPTATSMSTISARAARITPRWTPIIATVAALLFLGGAWRAESLEQFLGYLMVLAAATLPSVVWLTAGARGIPVFPAVALFHVPYYAWPVLSGNETLALFTGAEILQAAVTISMFLLASTAAWIMFLQPRRSTDGVAVEPTEKKRIIRFLLVGLLIGNAFHVAVINGWFAMLGSVFGVARSIAITWVMVACFLLGVARARGLVRGKTWFAAALALTTLIFLCFGSLFLVGGVMYAAAALLGYVIVARRIPWRALGAMMLLVAILHAGKAEMRARYWAADTNSGGVSSVLQLPGLVADWIAEGVSAIVQGEVRTSALDRASLLQMILLAQVETPENVDFLRGETYAMLPSVLLPRFIHAEKAAAQIGMDLLNIRYGLLTLEGAATTAIGWGLIAEAYANFGYIGILVVACLLGILCALLANWASRARIVSAPTLVSIAVMMALLNLEADSVSLFSTLLQSAFSALVFAAIYRVFVSGRHDP